MKHLLSTDFLKARKSVSFKIFLLLEFLLGFSYIAMSLSWDDERAAAMGAATGTRNMIWGLTQSMNDAMLVMICVPIIIFLTSEFGNKTVMIPLTKGISRTKYYVSKYITSCIMAIVLFLFYSLSAMLFSAIFYGIGEVNISSLLSFIGFQILNLIGIVSFWSAISFIIRKVTLTTVINVLFIFLWKLLFSAVNALLSLDQDANTHLWIGSTIINFRNISISSNTIQTILIIVLAYLILFNFIGLLVFNKTDIKS